MTINKASHSKKTVYFGNSISQITKGLFVKLTEVRVSQLQGKWPSTVLFYFKRIGTVIKQCKLLL